jgi:autoinducer 2-degrading protein
MEGSSFLLYQVYDDEAAYLAHRELPHCAEFRTLAEPWMRSRRVLTYEAVVLGDEA